MVVNRIAALYDIHGNLPALEAVMKEVRRLEPDLVLIGGDVIPGPMPAETLSFLFNLALPLVFISGNGEREVLSIISGNEMENIPENYRAAMHWVAEQISPEHRELISQWPQTFSIEVNSLGEVLFCHATPRNDAEIFTASTSESVLLSVFANVAAALVVCGHTHMQFDRMVSNTRIVNAGSVGMPFGEAGAYWLLLGPTVELRYTPYDLEQASRIIRRTSYPLAEEFAGKNILDPPAAKDMMALFSKAELKQ